MNRQSQWIFEAPFAIPEYDIHFQPESEWEFLEHEYTPSSVRKAFEKAVDDRNWRSAYLNLNGLNMYEMLRALDSLSTEDLKTFWDERTPFVRTVNMSRIDYAWKVVMDRTLPPAIGGLKETGQVQDAVNFINERPCRLPPPLTLKPKTPARDLRRQEARDIVVYLLREGAFTLKQQWSPLKLGSKCEIIQPQPNTRIAIEPAIISNVRFVNRVSRKSNVLFNLDVRMVVLLYRLAELLRTKWGITEIHHMGIGQGRGNAKDCHNTGRALDFAGVVGRYQDQPYTLDVLKDWGKQPVPMPDGTTRVNWPANLTQTTYRLNPTKSFLAFSIFRDVYMFGAREAADTSTAHRGNIAAPTQLGKESRFILHPDYPNPEKWGRPAHQDHIHMQIGPTGEEKNPP